MIPVLWDQARRTFCMIFHWHRVRDSYGNCCKTCRLYW